MKKNAASERTAMEYKYAIRETHINTPDDPSPVCLHETSTSSPIVYDGNDLVIPMQDGFTVRPNCPPNQTALPSDPAAKARLYSLFSEADYPGDPSELISLAREHEPMLHTFCSQPCIIAINLSTLCQDCGILPFVPMS